MFVVGQVDGPAYFHLVVFAFALYVIDDLASYSLSPLDLHVLGTPPAFVLSQDQTLTKKFNHLLKLL